MRVVYLEWVPEGDRLTSEGYCVEELARDWASGSISLLVDIETGPRVYIPSGWRGTWTPSSLVVMLPVSPCPSKLWHWTRCLCGSSDGCMQPHIEVVLSETAQWGSAVGCKGQACLSAVTALCSLWTVLSSSVFYTYLQEMGYLLEDQLAALLRQKWLKLPRSNLCLRITELKNWEAL